MQKLSLCTSASLRGNSFTGELPDWIGDMRSLEILDLSANNFSGPVLNSIGDLQFLKELNLSSNRFTGSLPESLANCKSLLAVDVSQNLLTGDLPGWTFKLGLKSVLLSGNRLSGSIEYPSLPSGAASYRSLEVLDLSWNAFSGEIASYIGNFTSLQFLNMSVNSMIGSIPVTVGDLKAARVLDLSRNRLDGQAQQPQPRGLCSSGDFLPLLVLGDGLFAGNGGLAGEVAVLVGEVVVVGLKGTTCTREQ
ncbi:hypothetical protein RJ640_009945 [Escallonia rubra]|uniref:Uncharacterized protein n=1 Tax=Escallonia rubra TaxID=112253 RepID=A0AA88UI93_9ASTE|nr:hypothetical protein RJ640_009945 [Escallonia rubra]